MGVGPTLRPGDIGQDIEPAERFNMGCDQFVNLLVVTDIASGNLNPNTLGSTVGRHGFESLGTEVGEEQVDALTR